MNDVDECFGNGLWWWIDIIHKNIKYVYWFEYEVVKVMYLSLYPVVLEIHNNIEQFIIFNSEGYNWILLRSYHSEKFVTVLLSQL